MYKDGREGLLSYRDPDCMERRMELHMLESRDLFTVRLTPPFRSSLNYLVLSPKYYLSVSDVVLGLRRSKQKPARRPPFPQLLLQLPTTAGRPPRRLIGGAPTAITFKTNQEYIHVHIGTEYSKPNGHSMFVQCPGYHQKKRVENEGASLSLSLQRN